MNDGKLTIDLSGVGNDIPTKLGKSRPTLTGSHHDRDLETTTDDLRGPGSMY